MFKMAPIAFDDVEEAMALDFLFGGIPLDVRGCAAPT